MTARATQADIARALKAARKAGVRVMEVNGCRAHTEAPAPVDPLKQPEGFVYVVGFSGFVKIGWSKNVQSRMRELQINLPEMLKLHIKIHAHPRLERALHKRFSHLRTRGEWFRHEDDLAAWIDAGCPV